LDAGRPLQYGGQDPNGDSGHAFVCDGYNSDDYFHFNWGWAGSYNGYFSLNNLDTGANNGQAGAGNGVYTRNQNAVFGIEPGSMVPAPTNLTYTLSGLNNITLTWDAVSAASSYNVYRNGNLVGNTTETTYSEAAPFGELSYYVRCVDANSQLSLSSNTVTVTIAYQTPIVTDLTATLSGNNANLTWTAPEWCYPETPSATLTYGNGNLNGINSNRYWAHRYLSDNLSQYVNKAIYKISIYAYETGSYTCYIYKGATETSSNGDNIFWPSTLMTSKTIEVTSTSEWIDIDLDELVTVDGQDDIWVVMYDPQNGSNGRLSATFSNNPGNNNHGGYKAKYYSFSGLNLIPGYVLENNRAFLIRTYLTDGTYTYNLYQDGTVIAQELDETTYTVDLNNDASNLFCVKTNYYGGETEASNKIGFAKGNVNLATLGLSENDKMTVTENSTLTVSGTLSDVNTDNLILENGAQLINSSTDVQATVKKNITAYTQNGGWHLLASPIESVTPTVNNGLLANNYDLYSFDLSEELEWRNIKDGAFNTIDNKTGYLYANSSDQTLSLEGT
ncbi:MAG: C10 family peptidase, partial [Prevotella sp.]|nr:C10 family peptidase [Prevotella sp.]